eukprot:2952335-Amphidinium_carterae.1
MSLTHRAYATISQVVMQNPQSPLLAESWGCSCTVQDKVTPCNFCNRSGGLELPEWAWVWVTNALPACHKMARKAMHIENLGKCQLITDSNTRNT